MKVKIISLFLLLSMCSTSSVKDSYIEVGDNDFLNLRTVKDNEKVLIDALDLVLLSLGMSSEYFWSSFEEILKEFVPRNKKLLEKREIFQSQIDEWHIERKGETHNHAEYKDFLTEIDYLVEDEGDFHISTANVDPEIKTIAGPQLVVPVMNARFALNATNARWGSLYDALYVILMIYVKDLMIL